MSYYSCLEFDNDSDNESDISSYKPFENIDNLNYNNVETLYKYFEYTGKPIGKEHIYASLRRNYNDINKAGRDLEYILNNTDIGIRLYSKKYLTGQDWQIKPTKGMYLVYENTVYKIDFVSFKDNYIYLDQVLLKKYGDKHIHLSEDDVRFGKYKHLLKDDLQEQLEKEYKILCDKCDDMYKNYLIWYDKIFEQLNSHRDKIREIENEHNNLCTSSSKLKVFIHAPLPVEIIAKIKEYGLESKCSHFRNISYLKENMEELYDILDDDYEPYQHLKWDKEVAYHMLSGDYEEWLDDF